MCTLVLLRRPGDDWPVLIAANRDEMADRPWQPPARHWPDRPEVTAGIDKLAGGTWLGVNDFGLFAGILNRRHSLGADPNLRSRGELVLDALDYADAVDAAEAFRSLNAHAYRAFNLLIADNRDAFWVCGLGPDGPPAVSVKPVPDGITMFTAFDPDDQVASPRINLYRPKFERAALPDPATGDWSAWQELMAAREFDAEHGPAEAMTIVTDAGFGTLSSSLIALPSIDQPAIKPIWLFAGGRPGETDYTPMPLDSPDP